MFVHPQARTEQAAEAIEMGLQLAQRVCGFRDRVVHAVL